MPKCSLEGISQEDNTIVHNVFNMYTMYTNTNLSPNQKGDNSFVLVFFWNVYWPQAVRIEHLQAESCGLLCWNFWSVFSWRHTWHAYKLTKFPHCIIVGLRRPDNQPTVKTVTTAIKSKFEEKVNFFFLLIYTTGQDLWKRNPQF